MIDDIICTKKKETLANHSDEGTVFLYELWFDQSKYNLYFGESLI